MVFFERQFILAASSAADNGGRAPYVHGTRSASFWNSNLALPGLQTSQIVLFAWAEKMKPAEAETSVRFKGGIS